MRACAALCLVAACVLALPAEARRKKKAAPPPAPTLSSLRIQLMPIAGVAGGDAFVDGLKRALVNRGALVVVGPDGGPAPDLVVDNAVAKGKVRVFGSASGTELFSVSIKSKPKKTFLKGVIPVVEAIEAAAPKLKDKGSAPSADGGGSFDWNDPAGLKKGTTPPTATPDDDDDDVTPEATPATTTTPEAPPSSETTSATTPATTTEPAASDDSGSPFIELSAVGGGAAWSWSYAESEGTSTLPPQRATYLGGGLELTLRPLSFLVVNAGYDASGVTFALPEGGGIVPEGDPSLSLQHRVSAAVGVQTDVVDDGLLRLGGRLGYRLWLSDGAQNAKFGELDLTFIPGSTLHAPVVGALIGSSIGPVRVDVVVDVAPYALYSESPDNTGDAGYAYAAFGVLALAFDVTDNVFVAARGDAAYLHAETSGEGDRNGFIDDTIIATGGGVIEQTRFGGGLGLGLRF